MRVKCSCPNCGYPHLVEDIRKKIEQIQVENEKEQDGLPSEN